MPGRSWIERAIIPSRIQILVGHVRCQTHASWARLILVIVCVVGSANGSGSKVPLAAVIDQQTTDSRGETVYRFRAPQDSDQMIVAGVLAPPTPIRLPDPACPSRENCTLMKVHVSGIVSQDGQLIDAVVLDGGDPQLSRSFARALPTIRFKPAKLNGSPVAFNVRLELESSTSFPFLL